MFFGSSLEADYKFFKREIEEKQKNGTPSEKAAIATADLALSAVPVIVGVGVCTFVIDTTLNSFSVFKDVSNKGTFSTGACASLMAAFYIGYKDEEMKKAEAQRNSWFGSVGKQ